MGRRKGSEGSVPLAPGGSGDVAGATAQPNGRVRRVRDVVTDYIEARKNSALAPIAIRTVRDHRSVRENHVSRRRADIVRIPVHQLTGRDIRQWMDALAADGVGMGTISNARRVLGAALAWEVREGRLGVNPATHVRIESSKARRAAMQTVDPVLLPSWSDFATLVDTPEDEHDRPRLGQRTHVSRTAANICVEYSPAFRLLGSPRGHDPPSFAQPVQHLLGGFILVVVNGAKSLVLGGLALLAVLQDVTEQQLAVGALALEGDRPRLNEGDERGTADPEEVGCLLSGQAHGPRGNRHSETSLE